MLFNLTKVQAVSTVVGVHCTKSRYKRSVLDETDVVAVEYLNSLLIIYQNDNSSPGAVTGAKF